MRRSRSDSIAIMNDSAQRDRTIGHADPQPHALKQNRSQFYNLHMQRRRVPGRQSGLKPAISIPCLVPTEKESSLPFKIRKCEKIDYHLHEEMACLDLASALRPLGSTRLFPSRFPRELLPIFTPRRTLITFQHHTTI